MSQSVATLHCMFGKPASGKSTLSARLALDKRTVAISEDSWLAALYGNDIRTLADFSSNSRRLRQAITPLLQSLLDQGISVALDFQANTVPARQWMRTIAEQAGARCVLHVLDVPDAICISRLDERRAQGNHPFTLSSEQFHQVAEYIVPPTNDEGFEIIRHPMT